MIRFCLSAAGAAGLVRVILVAMGCVLSLAAGAADQAEIVNKDHWVIQV